MVGHQNIVVGVDCLCNLGQGLVKMRVFYMQPRVTDACGVPAQRDKDTDDEGKGGPAPNAGAQREHHGMQRNRRTDPQDQGDAREVAFGGPWIEVGHVLVDPRDDTDAQAPQEPLIQPVQFPVSDGVGRAQNKPRSAHHNQGPAKVGDHPCHVLAHLRVAGWMQPYGSCGDENGKPHKKDKG